MIIADANAWIDFLKRPSSTVGETLERLIRESKLAVIGVVLAELLRGSRTDGERKLLANVLTGLEYFEMSRATWERAGQIAMDLDLKGTRIAMTDIFIAAIAIEGGHQVFSRDKDFERIPGLGLYDPDEEHSNA